MTRRALPVKTTSRLAHERRTRRSVPGRPNGWSVRPSLQTRSLFSASLNRGEAIARSISVIEINRRVGDVAYRDESNVGTIGRRKPPRLYPNIDPKDRFMSTRSKFLGLLSTLVLPVGMSIFAPACSDPEDTGPERLFSEQVAPVLESRCTAQVCHGVRSSRLEQPEVSIPEGALYFRIDSNGQLEDLESARASARQKINTVEDPEFSTLLRKPLSPEWGGLPHRGSDNFASTRASAYEAVESWIESEKVGGEDPPKPELSEREQTFAEQVQPTLMRRNCAAENCHGPTTFNHFRLDPGIPTREGDPKFSAEMTRSNYRMVRGFLALDSPPAESRLLRKALPTEDGGIVHRGGDENLFEDRGDTAFAAVEQWAREERLAVAREQSFDSSARGLLFVRGPIRSRSPFAISTFTPGRDIHLREPAGSEGETRNLTAELHDSPADLRDPDIGPDGRKFVFSMRRSRDSGFHIWEMDLDSGEARKVTDGPDRLESGQIVANLSPVYGGDDFIYFTSNRHDRRAERGTRLDYDLYRIPVDGGEPTRLTHTPSPELAPDLFRVAPFRGYLVFSYRRAVDHRDQTIGFSLPVDFHTDYHIYFGRTAEPDLLYQFTEMPDGRSLVIGSDPSNVWAGGSLAVVDRSLGPDLRADSSAADAAIPAYAPTYHAIDDDVSPTGMSPNGLYRDPVALPDGSLLVAHSPSPVDARDPGASVEYRIERIQLDERTPECTEKGCDGRIESRSVWVDRPGISDFDPEPVRSWLSQESGAPELQPDDTSEPARYSMANPAVNNAITTNLPPEGPKEFRDDIAYVRFIEALPQPPGRWGPIDSKDSLPGPTTNTTAGHHLPSRILGEVPVEPDGSVSVRLPPNTPFRTQFLDEQKMVVGRPHNRWLYAWPGQHFKQSTLPELYDQRCAGCHGSSTGRPIDAWRQPDATSSASLTLARYDDADPLKPRPPLELGDDTRKTVDFRSDIEPIIDAHCTNHGCHSAASSAGGLNLSTTETEHYSVAYEHLLAKGSGSKHGMKYIDQAAGRARTSYLVEVLRDTELNAPRELQPHPPLQLSDEEILTVVRWIETGAHYDLADMVDVDGR